MGSEAPSVLVAHSDDAPALAALGAFFSQENPGYTLTVLTLTGEDLWTASQGVAFWWLQEGAAEVKIDGEWHPPRADLQGAHHDWLALQPGDVVVVDAEHAARVRGKARFWQILCSRRARSAWAGVHRLQDLVDQAGGCNVGDDAFRRLQITWQTAGQTLDDPDGDNLLGCHVVYIAEATSRTHYHPRPPLVGGRNQHELYLVLDPQAYGLKVQAATPGVWTYARPGEWDRYEFTPLRPGDVCAIRAGVAHRAVDVLACVIAVPGFKPGNDVYVDQRIAAETGGRAPHNPRFARGNEG
jgi:hypothetical protein